MHTLCYLKYVVEHQLHFHLLLLGLAVFSEILRQDNLPYFVSSSIFFFKIVSITLSSSTFFQRVFRVGSQLLPGFVKQLAAFLSYIFLFPCIPNILLFWKPKVILTKKEERRIIFNIVLNTYMYMLRLDSVSNNCLLL